jgi:hypothetical protein
MANGVLEGVLFCSESVRGALHRAGAWDLVR